MIRKADEKDIAAIANIYNDIHTEEEAGRITTGWIRGIYPTEETAKKALANDELYVLEQDGIVLASAKINQLQDDVYVEADWEYPADDELVLVLHTLVVSPAAAGKGIGRRFVAFYEELAHKLGCLYLRMDTNARNTVARRLYKKLGYKEVGIVPCCFNGLEGVNLVCLEKKI